MVILFANISLLFTSTQVHQECPVTDKLILELSVVQQIFNSRPQLSLATHAVFARTSDHAQEFSLRVSIEIEQFMEYLARLFDLQAVQIH